MEPKKKVALSPVSRDQGRGFLGTLWDIANSRPGEWDKPAPDDATGARGGILGTPSPMTSRGIAGISEDPTKQAGAKVLWGGPLSREATGVGSAEPLKGAVDADKASMKDGTEGGPAGGAGAAPVPTGPQYATKTSTTVRKGIDLEKMGGFGPKHFMRASDQQKVALRDQAKAQAETNQQLAQEYMKSPQEREAAAEEYEDQRMAVQHQVQQVRTRLAQMEREAAKEVVDPDRYWDNADIGKKMAYITAAADAGAAAGFMGRAGGANPILTMASRMIVADINAQKSNIAFAAGRRGEVRGLLGSLQRQVKDIGTAEALTYKRLAMDTSDRLKGIALQSSSPSLKARAEAAAGALDQKAMQMGNQAAAMMADRISQTTQRVPFRAGGAGGKKKDDFEQRKYDALAGLNRLGEFIKLADASWVEALKFAAPRDISARAEQYTTTRTTTALAVWKMFDNGKLSDQDLRVALTLLKPKWTMIHSWTRRPAKANLAEMRRRLTAGRKLKAAMHSGKTYDTSAKAKAALKVQWREQGLPTE